MENIRDWCVSRQLWWGHRIPAYYVVLPGDRAGSHDDPHYWVVARTPEAALRQAAERFALPAEQITLEQDPDVLDTWFSSALFPFSIFGWPEETEELRLFFPGTLLETGHDILFFWVARMVMMSHQLCGKPPFRDVFLHAIVRDAHGRKMSKSLGNVIDPVDIIQGISLDGLHQQLIQGNLDKAEFEIAKRGQQEDFPKGIPECGTDALRFALLAYVAQGRDINLDVNRVLGYRHFCNKLWNAVKFVKLRLGDGFVPHAHAQEVSMQAAMDRWILSRLAAAAEACERGFKEYDFPHYTTAIYNFWLYELCDVYLECTKPIFADGSDDAAREACRQALYTCAETGLRLLAPAMPLITEELWQRLPRRAADAAPSIHVSAFPDVEQHARWRDAVLDADVELVRDVVRALRTCRDQYLQPRDRPSAFVRALQPDREPVLARFASVLRTLANLHSVEILPTNAAAPAGAAMETVTGRCEVFVLVKGHVDVGLELRKLADKLARTEQSIAKLQKTMQIPDYETRVVERVRQDNAERLSTLQVDLANVHRAIATYEAMQ